MHWFNGNNDETVGAGTNGHFCMSFDMRYGKNYSKTKTVTKATIYGPNNDGITTNGPSNATCYISASADETTNTVPIGNGTVTNSENSGKPFDLLVDSPSAYKIYMINCTNTFGDTNLFLSEIEFYEQDNDCTYSSGDWVIDDGSDYTLSSVTDLGSNKFKLHSGTVRIESGGGIRLTAGCFVQDGARLFAEDGALFYCRN